MIALPVPLPVALAAIVNPTLALLPAQMTSDAVRVQLLAMGLQESRFNARAQLNGGPAHGFWQAEQGGMVRGVLKSPATRQHALALCLACAVQPLEAVVWDALEDDDFLACGIARLGLWADANPMPAIGDSDAAWQCYLRNWRPGHPRPETWAGFYASASSTTTAS